MSHCCSHKETKHEDGNNAAATKVASGEKFKEKKNRSLALPVSIVIAALIVGGSLVYFATAQKQTKVQGEEAISTAPSSSATQSEIQIDQELVIPSGGVELPAVWGDLGKQLVETGVIDQDKFEALYAQRGGLNSEMQALLTGADTGRLRITPENAQYLLNLSWALGIGNKNSILEQGPMVDERYGGAGGFASTGGWTLAQGDAMDHYSKHEFITLTSEQQARVERVSQGIYRPCCGNSTYFPDCNHGMAMLGLLELMASQGASEDEMYDAALAINSYWFPSTYLTIAKFYAANGVSWDRVDPREALSANYSSSQGYRQVLAQVQPAQVQGGGGCGV